MSDHHANADHNLGLESHDHGGHDHGPGGHSHGGVSPSVLASHEAMRTLWVSLVILGVTAPSR